MRWEHAIETWERIIEPACVQLGLSAVRADGIAKAGEITEQVFKLIRDADVVIADVTGGNSNVMYELGLRHTLNKITIQIGEYGQLPFDISVIRTLRFLRTPVGFVDARKTLCSLLAAALKGDFDPVTVTRLWSPLGTSEIVATSIAAQPNSGIEVDEPGALDLLAEMEAAFPELNSLVARSTQAMQGMTILAERATASIRESDAARAGFAGRLRIANKMASDLAPVADEFEAIAEGCERQVTSIAAGMACLLDLVEQNPAQVEEMGEFPDAIQAFVTNVREANKRQAEFATAISGTGKFSKPMRISTRRIGEATRRIAKSLDPAEVWNARVQQIVARTKGGAAVRSASSATA